MTSISPVNVAKSLALACGLILLALPTVHADGLPSLSGQTALGFKGGSSANVGINAGSPDAAQAKSIVQAYMHQALPPPHFVTFLDWKDYSVTGPATSITLKYQDQSAYARPVVAMVRFLIEGGKVIKTEVVQNAPSVAATPSPTPARSVAGKNRFADALNAAKYCAPMAVKLSDGYALADLEKAKAQAQAEKKPLGFLMVWGQFFNVPGDARNHGGNSALLHFYKGFHENVVLVFVRHENELGKVPAAVNKGFRGPDEGGFAPNMAVTDARATEFIVEIPTRGKDGPGRDALFAAGAEKINAWMDTHPDALPIKNP